MIFRGNNFYKPKVNNKWDNAKFSYYFTKQRRCYDATGAEVNTKGEDGFTAIQNACFNWNIEIIKILLENKANPFLKNDLGYDVFYYASEENHNKNKAKKITELLKEFY